MANALRQVRELVCLHALVLFLCNSGLTLSAITVRERKMLHAGVVLPFKEDIMVLLVFWLILGCVVDCALIR